MDVCLYFLCTSTPRENRRFISNPRDCAYSMNRLAKFTDRSLSVCFQDIIVTWLHRDTDQKRSKVGVGLNNQQGIFTRSFPPCSKDCDLTPNFSPPIFHHGDVTVELKSLFSKWLN